MNINIKYYKTIFDVISRGSLFMICLSLLANCGPSIRGRQPMSDVRGRDSSYDLYLLIGQSNMAGRGAITDEYAKQGADNLLMLDSNNHWVRARHPLHFDKPSVAGVGPGLSFGLVMAGKDPGRIVGLVPCAVGGTSIRLWTPGAYDKATRTHPYDDMVLRITEAQKMGSFKGILWLQGESDSNPDSAKTYLSKLITLIGEVRSLTGDPELPFVAGEIGRFKEQYASINQQLSALPRQVPMTAVASSEGFTDKGDQTHFDSRSADAYGRRFADKMILLNSQSSTSKHPK